MLAAVQTNNAVISDAMQRLVALGLIAPVIGGTFRGVSALVDAAKPAPDVLSPAAVVPVPVPPAKKKPAIMFAADGKPVPTEGLHPLGAPLYRDNTAQPANAAAGHNADTAWGVPWYVPAMTALTVGGAYGGYKAVDSLVNKKRKADLKGEIDEAKQDFLRELATGYKAAGEAPGSLWSLAALRCKAANETPEHLQPAESQTLANVGGLGAGAGITALAALLGLGGVAGYRHAVQNDPARIAKRRAERQVAEQWATAPPEVVAVPVPG